MARPRTLSLPERRQSILRAAHALLSERGYSNVRLDDVAAKARVAKGTLYLYFRNKEDLCTAVMSDVVERLGAQIRSIPVEAPAFDVLRQIARVEMAFILENQDFLSQFSSRRAANVSSQAAKELKHWFADHIGFLARLLDRGVKEKALRAHNTRQGAYFFVALARMFALHEVEPRGGEPLDVLSDEMMDLFLHGVGRMPKRQKDA